MDEQDVLAAIKNGESAYGLLLERAPGLERRWNRMCKTMIDFMADARRDFPDAQYYTASGGLHLLLGNPHADNRSQSPQQELVALSGSGVNIGDGDF